MSHERSSGIRGAMESVGLVDSRPISQTPRRNLVRWCLLAGCVVTVLVILAGLSQHFAMPILFPLGFGVGVGLALSEMSRILMIDRRVFTTAVTGLAVAAGLVAVTVNWSAQYQAKTQAWNRQHPLRKDPLAAPMEAALNTPPATETEAERKTRLEVKASVEDARARLEKEEARRRESTTFGGYLRDRWTNFGPFKDLATPWPLILWVTELLVATSLASVLQWTSGRPSRPLGDETPASAVKGDQV